MSAATWFVKNHDRAVLFYGDERVKAIAQSQMLTTTCTSLYGVLVELAEALRLLYQGDIPMSVFVMVQEHAAWYQRHKSEGMSLETRGVFLTEALARQFKIMRVCAQAIEVLEQQQAISILREGVEHAQRTG
jgi:hypothetical protein